jgi:hypothetical protein
VLQRLRTLAWTSHEDGFSERLEKHLRDQRPNNDGLLLWNQGRVFGGRGS